MPDQSSFVALTHGGDLGLLSADAAAIARPAAKAAHLGAVETARPTRLFDDLFGASALSVPTPATSYDAPLRKAVGDDLFAAPAHVLPPLRMLWRHALPLRPLVDEGAEAEPAVVAVDEGAMDVDEPLRTTRDLPPLSAAETDALSAIFGARLRVSASAS